LGVFRTEEGVADLQAILRRVIVKKIQKYFSGTSAVQRRPNGLHADRAMARLRPMVIAYRGRMPFAAGPLPARPVSHRVPGRRAGHYRDAKATKSPECFRQDHR